MQKSRFINRYSCHEAFCRSIKNEVTRTKYVSALATFLQFTGFKKYEQLLQMKDKENEPIRYIRYSKNNSCITMLT